uniref:PDZ domain-containing protein n=1 Tax=Entomoneis paludosa TaxID=265537 RepID=A0A7S2VD21_9STRA
MMSPTSTSNTINHGNPNIDVTLLRGLEPAMTVEEQEQLTAMLTSGDPNELARAAQIFHGIGTLLKEQGVVHVNQRSPEQQTQIRDSFQLTYRPKERLGFNNREERVAHEKKENERDQKSRAAALPLPVRMPRYEAIEAFDPDEGRQVEKKKLLGVVPTSLPGTGPTRTLKPSLNFVDDSWDGTLEAAFTKLTVQNQKPENKGQVVAKVISPLLLRRDSSGTMVQVQHEFKSSPGFDEIVSVAPEGYQTKLIHNATGSTPSDVTDSGVLLGEPRVLIARTHYDAAKLGLQRGDVVTHVNGQEFIGNTQDLHLLLKALNADSEVSRFELVVNAEPCVAQALKLRALASEL